MDYEEYKNLNRAKEVFLSINRSHSMRLIDYLPMRYRFAHHTWAWIWFLSLPGAFVAGYFWGWWITPFVIFFSYCTHGAIRQSSAEFVLEHADENEQFYNALVAQNLLRFIDSRGDFVDSSLMQKITEKPYGEIE